MTHNRKWSSANEPDSVDRIIESFGLMRNDFGIEEYLAAVDAMERRIGIEYVRLDFGVPGLPPARSCIEGHTVSLREGDIPQRYPPAAGLEKLRKAGARFIKSRLVVELDYTNVFATCGGTQALLAAQAIAANLHPARRTVVLLTPTYPPVFAQASLLGLKTRLIELDGLRGEVLLKEIAHAFAKGDVCAIFWASPNNPTWTVLTRAELKGLAALCKEHEVIPIEDLTYLGMAVAEHSDIQPGFPSIAQFAADYFLVLSASKMLSYAGERVGLLVGSTSLLRRSSKALAQMFGVDSVGRACSSLIFNLTAGAPHSAQYGVADVLETVNEGTLRLEETLSVYSHRSRKLKKVLQSHGFYRIYGTDEKDELDGFYVCFGFAGLNGFSLLRRLLRRGITVLPLTLFGSERRDGVRACVGRLDQNQLAMLDARLARFNEERGI